MSEHLVDNRYRKIKKLGEGGMGAVYLVNDLSQEGKRVALKVINAKSLTLESITSFKSEFEAMTKLRHPNLAEVYDFGTIKEGSQYYFTLEYIQGQDLFQATEKSNWAEICELTVQICRALAYLHSRGFIHYDIKPSNILVSRSESNTNPVVKLLDFGLARPMDEKPRDEIWGTPHYIAPEMIKGEKVDERADLYSLGVVLYHITARQVPFEGKDSFSILKKHIELPPPLDCLEKRLSKDQISIITKLLAKEPAGRYTNAHKVIEAINGLAESTFEVETKETKESYVLGGRFIGRDAEFERLRTLSEDLKARRGQQETPLILIHGEGGIGKSRLLREIRYFGQLNDIPFLQGNCLESGGVVCQAFVDVLQQAISLSGTSNESSSIVTEYESDLAKLIPPTYISRILGMHDGDARQADDLTDAYSEAETSNEIPVESLQLAPEQERLRLIDRITEFLLRLAEKKPYVIVIEDLQWGDELTTDILHYLARNASSSSLVTLQDQSETRLNKPKGLLILVSCREEKLADQIEAEIASHSSLRVFYELIHEPYSLEMRLERLSPKSVEELLGSMLGTDVLPNNLVDRVLQCTGGNPFFVEEAMKSLVENDAIYFRDGRWRVTEEGINRLQLPESITEALQERLEGLAESHLQVLKVISAFGRPVTSDLLSEISGIERQTLTDMLAQLEREQVLASQFQHQVYEYGFLHPEMWSIIYDKLDDSEKRTLHDTIGNTLEKLYHGSLNEHLEELGYHFIRGKDDRKAIDYGIKAGNKLKSIYANDNAIEFYEKVLNILAKPKTPDAIEQLGLTSDWTYPKGLVLLNLGEVYSFTGRYDEALKNYQSLLDIWLEKTSPNHGADSYVETDTSLNVDEELLADVYQKMGHVYEMKGEYDKAIKYLKEGEKFLADIGKSLERARISEGLGRVYFWKGQYDEAMELYLKGLSDLEDLGYNSFAGAIYNDLGALYQYTCKYDLAAKYFENALEIRNRVGDLAGTARSLNNLGNISIIGGKYAQAVDYYQQSLKIKEKIGYVHGVSASLNNLGLTHYRLGNYTEAEAYYQRSLEIKEKISDTSGMSLALDNLGLVYYSMARYSQAIAYFNRALELYGENVERGMIETLNNLGLLYAELGKNKEAEDLAYKALELSKKFEVRDCEGMSNKLIGKICASRGQLSEALEYFEKALYIFQELEDKIEACLCLVEMAGTLHRKGGSIDALKLAEEALSLSDELGLKVLKAQCLLMKGIVKGNPSGDLEEGKTREAIKLLENALELAKEIDIPEVLWRSYYFIGLLRHRERKFDSALSCYERCIGVFESVCSNLDDESLKCSYLKSGNRFDVIKAIKELKAEVTFGQEKKESY